MEHVEGGFDTIGIQSKRISAIISDIACLIDTQKDPETVVQLKTGGQIRPGLNMHTDALPLYSLSKNIDEGLFSLLVIGRFKNGKSTLLNAMLGDKQLPTGSTPTTGVITMIVYGQDESVEVFEYEKSEPRILSRDEFFAEYKLKTQDATELREFRFQNVRYARMYSQHQICQRGVRLVDSPGLGEHSSRSEVTQAFLKEAQAIILVLDAIHLLGDDEQEFIHHYLGNESRTDRVFFVVNRINQIEEGVEELKELPKFILRPYFLNEAGEFDKQFYNKRVFWVNALAALKARQTTPVDQDRLNETMVPDLERELEAFLTEGKMFRAQLDSTLAELRRTAQKSFSYIHSEKSALEKPLTELTISRDKVNTELSTLEYRCEDIQDNINQTEENVRLKLELHLRDFVDEFLTRFEKDLPALVEQLTDVTFGDVALAGFNNDRKQKIVSAVRKTVESYLHARFIEWSNEAVDTVREDIDKLKDRLATRIDEFELSLANARAEFSGETEIIPYEDHQMTIAKTTTIWVGGTGLMGIIGGTVRRLVTLLLLFSISTMGAFGFALFVVMLLAEIGIISDQEPALKRDMLRKIVARIQNGLDRDLRTNEITTASFIDLSGLLEILKKRARPLDLFIWKNLSDETRIRIDKFKHFESTVDTKRSEEIAELLAVDLTQIVCGQNLYTDERFEQIKLSDETIRLLKINPSGSELELLNRFLIVDAYPDYLSPKLRDLIYRGVKTQFLSVSSDITGSVRIQIDQLREQMDTTITNLTTKTFSVENEKHRLDDVAAKILELLNQASQIAGQRTYATIEDVLAHRD